MTNILDFEKFKKNRTLPKSPKVDYSFSLMICTKCLSITFPVYPIEFDINKITCDHCDGLHMICIDGPVLVENLKIVNEVLRQKKSPDTEA